MIRRSFAIFGFAVLAAASLSGCAIYDTGPSYAYPAPGYYYAPGYSYAPPAYSSFSFSYGRDRGGHRPRHWR